MMSEENIYRGTRSPTAREEAQLQCDSNKENTYLSVKDEAYKRVCA